MNAIVGDAYSLPFHLLVDREYVVPTSGTLTYTIYDNSGSAIAGQTDEDITTNSETTKVDVAIPSSVQTVASGKSFEQRTVVVRGTFDGQTRSFRRSYYVTEFLNHTVVPEDVLNLLGLLDGELPPDIIPLVPAFFEVQSTMGDTVFTTALSSGTVDQIEVNNAIKLQAALGFLDTLELRAFRKAGGEGLSFTRFESIDFNGLRDRIKADLKSRLSTLGVDSGEVTLFTLSQPTDAITGA